MKNQIKTRSGVTVTRKSATLFTATAPCGTAYDVTAPELQKMLELDLNEKKFYCVEFDVHTNLVSASYQFTSERQELTGAPNNDQTASFSDGYDTWLIGLGDVAGVIMYLSEAPKIGQSIGQLD